MTDADKILTAEEIKDTKTLQLRSLCSYMEQLEYWYVVGDYFRSDSYKNKTRSTISFQTAVNLYNGHYNDNHGSGLTVAPFDFDVYSLNKAQAAKTVHKVKLQLCKKTGYIKTSSHIVEFTKPVYYQMFMNSKYFPF